MEAVSLVNRITSMSIKSICHFWHLQDIWSCCLDKFSVYFAPQSRMVLLWEVYWEYSCWIVWKFCIFSRHPRVLRKTWRVPLGIFPVTRWGRRQPSLLRKQWPYWKMHGFLNTYKKGGFWQTKWGSAGCQWALDHVLHGGGNLEGEKPEEEEEENVGGWTKRQTFHFHSQGFHTGNSDPKVHVRTVGSQERRGGTLSSRSQSPPTLFDSSFWKCF